MKLIAIGGCSGAGKSTLARALAAHLPDAATIALDSYYANRGPVANYDHPDALDWVLLVEHLDALGRGVAVSVPVYDFEVHARTDAVEVIEPAPIVIVEGILALHHDAVRRRSDMKVFVESESGRCLERRIERDIAERGRTHQSVVEQYWNYTAPMAAEYVLPSRKFADVIVSGERPVQDAVAAVAGHFGTG